MSEIAVEELLAFGQELADIGSEMLSSAYRSDFSVRQKEDQTAVTDIDEGVEKALREQIQRRYPNHGILGEEFGLTNCNSDYKWIIDPIDGTSSFIIGRPLFCQLIALQYKGEMLLGVIDQAISQERWWGAKGQASFYNGSQISVRACASLADAILCTTSEEYFSDIELNQFQHLAKHVKQRVYGGDAYNYALLAQGKVDVVVEAGLKPHDYAALIPVIEGAGGVITNWEGKPLDGRKPSTVLACGNPDLHAEIIRYLAG